MVTKHNEAISERIQTFVQDLSSLVRRSALDAVHGVLSGMTAPARRKPGRPAGAKTGRLRAVVRKAAKRGKRTTDQVEADAARLLAHIKANPGQRLEEISKALRTTTATLTLPVMKLLASKSIKKTGQKRGTMYFAGSARAKPAAKKKSAPKRKAKSRPKTKAKRAKKRGRTRSAKGKRPARKTPKSKRAKPAAKRSTAKRATKKRATAKRSTRKRAKARTAKRPAAKSANARPAAAKPAVTKPAPAKTEQPARKTAATANTPTNKPAAPRAPKPATSEPSAPKAPQPTRTPAGSPETVNA